MSNKIKNLKEFSGGLSDPFPVDFRLNSKCNYNCWYCKDMKNNSYNDCVVDLDRLTNFVKALNRRCAFFIYGGEPTLHPQILDVVQTIKNAMTVESTVGIQTNLSLSVDMIQSLRAIDPNLVLSVTYHHNECDFKEFLGKCVLAKDLVQHITVMYQSEFADDILTKYKYLNMIFPKKGVSELFPIMGSFNENLEHSYKEMDSFYLDKKALSISSSVGYSGSDLTATLEDGTSFKTNPNELWKNRENNFKDMMCNCSVDSITIDYDGSVYKCFNEIFDSSCKSSYNLFTDDNPEDYLKSLTAMKCPYERCLFGAKYKKVSE